MWCTNAYYSTPNIPILHQYVICTWSFYFGCTYYTFHAFVKSKNLIHRFFNPVICYWKQKYITDKQCLQKSCSEYHIGGFSIVMWGRVNLKWGKEYDWFIFIRMKDTRTGTHTNVQSNKIQKKRNLLETAYDFLMSPAQGRLNRDKLVQFLSFCSSVS